MPNAPPTENKQQKILRIYKLYSSRPWTLKWSLLTHEQKRGIITQHKNNDRIKFNANNIELFLSLNKHTIPVRHWR